MRDPARHLSVKDGEKFAEAIAKISAHVANELDRVRVLLPERNRVTLCYFHIIGVRPCKKRELYLDGSNHIVNVAESKGKPHWVQLILKRCDNDCFCNGD